MKCHLNLIVIRANVGSFQKTESVLDEVEGDGAHREGDVPVGGALVEPGRDAERFSKNHSRIVNLDTKPDGSEVF